MGKNTNTIFLVYVNFPMMMDSRAKDSCFFLPLQMKYCNHFSLKHLSNADRLMILCPDAHTASSHFANISLTFQ